MAVGFFQLAGEKEAWDFADYLTISAAMNGITKDNKPPLFVPVNKCSYQDLGIEPGGTTKMFPSEQSTIDFVKKYNVTFYCVELGDDFYLQGNAQTDYTWSLQILFSRWCAADSAVDPETGNCLQYETEKEELDRKLSNYQLITMQNS